MEQQIEFPFPLRIQKPRPVKYPSELKVMTLREVKAPEQMMMVDTPERVHLYWQTAIATSTWFCPERECFVVLTVNTRRRAKGHFLVAIGTLDTVLVSVTEVFRGAIAVAAAGVVLMHNHPSGDASPSEGDIKVTRDLIRAGQLLKITVLDHVIMGRAPEGKQPWCSLRELGYFYQG